MLVNETCVILVRWFAASRKIFWLQLSATLMRYSRRPLTA